MSVDTRPERGRLNAKLRRLGIYAAALVAAFLLGFLPMWLGGRQCGKSLAETERQLRMSRMQNDLAAAVINARRGEYEPARQAASQFFTSLREEVDKDYVSILTQAQREGMKPLLAGRDEIISLLARNDPASVDRLSDLYVSYGRLIFG